MYEKVPKTMGTCVPVGIEINGYWGKTMGNIPGMQRQKNSRIYITKYKTRGIFATRQRCIRA